MTWTWPKVDGVFWALHVMKPLRAGWCFETAIGLWPRKPEKWIALYVITNYANDSRYNHKYCLWEMLFVCVCCVWWAIISGFDPNWNLWCLLCCREKAVGKLKFDGTLMGAQLSLKFEWTNSDLSDELKFEWNRFGIPQIWVNTQIWAITQNWGNYAQITQNWVLHLFLRVVIYLLTSWSFPNVGSGSY